MKKIFLIAIALFAFQAAWAQQPNFIDAATADSLLKQSEATFPKFCRELTYIRTHDELIKQVNFSRSKILNGSPASASPRGVINIDISYLEHPKPDFDDNRLIVVLYHEIGHLHYFTITPPADRAPMNSEKAAFEYSLLKTKEMAEKGDCLPLKTGLKFMKLRSKSNNLQDPHVRALKLMVTEPLYFDYLKYAKEHCG
ncbi:hypothetical protein [Mucilaginibacter glaciei]|uniref:Uncharacterized protein n=1 Tax=Mucilaginibacter glaciei TaxID=2772109 RepID=A0A926S2Q5_9SPHI|nr:hypothetical protein [Mucilaginibacter glaciei]MBD1394107.1 hypothetical protein [Mucilaginibacter glaciei]